MFFVRFSEFHAGRTLEEFPNIYIVFSDYIRSIGLIESGNTTKFPLKKKKVIADVNFIRK